MLEKIVITAPKEPKIRKNPKKNTPNPRRNLWRAPDWVTLNLHTRKLFFGTGASPNESLPTSLFISWSVADTYADQV